MEEKILRHKIKIDLNLIISLIFFFTFIFRLFFLFYKEVFSIIQIKGFEFPLLFSFLYPISFLKNLRENIKKIKNKK